MSLLIYEVRNRFNSQRIRNMKRNKICAITFDKIDVRDYDNAKGLRSILYRYDDMKIVQ